MRESVRIFAGIAICFFSLSCNDGDGPVGPETPPSLASLVVSPSEANFAAIGDTVHFAATARDQRGHRVEVVNVTWSSADTTVVSVTATGVAQAVNPGRTKVTATISGEAGSYEASARAVVAARTLLLSPDSVFLPWPLLTEQLVLQVRDNATGNALRPDSVRWVSTDTTIATVSQTGVVTAIRKGTVQIAASTARQTRRAVVRVADPERDALVAFYHAMDGANWLRQDNWLTDQPIWEPPGWYGVTPIDGETPEQRSARLRTDFETLAATDSLPFDAFTAARKAEWQAWSESNPTAWAARQQVTGARLSAGRIASVALDNNNLRGVLSDTDMWNALPFMDDLSLGGNELTGELPSSFHNVELLNLGGNRLEGPIPRDLLRYGQFFGLGLRDNALSGDVPTTSAPNLLFLQLEKNDLTAGNRYLLNLNLNLLTWASWWDNDGLCVDGDLIDAAAANDAFLFGPRCGSEPGVVSSFAVSPGNAVFTALGDSILVEVTAIDDSGWRVEGEVTWLIEDPDVATIVPAADGMWSIKARANGTTSILGLPAGRSGNFRHLLDDPIEVTVKQLRVDSKEHSRLTLAAGTSFKWEEAAGLDRNGNPLPLHDGLRTVSSDSSILVAYRNQIFYARKKGTAVISSRHAGRVIAAAEITVTVPPLRPDPKDIPVITGLSADTLSGSSTVTIYGHSLDATDEVWIDGVRVRIEKRDTGAVRVKVPDIFSCTFPRNVAVIVRNEDGVGDVLLAPLKGAGEDLSVIPVATLYGPLPIPLNGETCLLSRGGHDEYLVGIQGWPRYSQPGGAASALGTIFEVEATTVEATTSDGGAANVSPVPPKIERHARRSEPQDARWLHRHREAELARWQRLQEELEKRPWLGRDLARAHRTSAVHANTVEGDTVLMRMSSTCGGFSEFPAAVRVVNDHVVLLSDTENEHDYTNAEYAEVAAIAADLLLPALITQFGPPPDVNGDGRVAMLFTDKVASSAGEGVLGFVNFLNFLPRSECASSNEMEVFIGTTPVPYWDRDLLLSILPSIVGHEITHIIQGRRFLAQETIESLGMDIWLAEAQAVLGEEINGHAAMGNAPANNYGAAVAQATDEKGRWWYWGPFADFSNFFGARAGPNTCSWWTDGFNDPCDGRSLWYGIGWSFMRWVADQYGPAFPNGEAGFNTALINAPSGNEIRNFESLLDEDFATLLAGWAAGLYLDDRLEAADASASFQMTSWNLADIFDARNISIPVAQPHRSHVLKAGSVIYYRFEENAFGEQLVKVRGKVSGQQDVDFLLSDAELNMQLFVVPLRESDKP